MGKIMETVDEKTLHSVIEAFGEACSKGRLNALSVVAKWRVTMRFAARILLYLKERKLQIVTVNPWLRQ